MLRSMAQTDRDEIFHHKYGHPVQRRHVLYLPGYDPMVPRRYRELYRTEGLKQAQVSGYSLQIEGLTGQENYTWLAETEIDGQRTQARIEFLGWNDIVQASMSQSLLATYILMLRTAWIYLSTGTLWHLFRLRATPMIAAIYPVVMLILYLFVGCVMGWIVHIILATFLPWPITLLSAFATLTAFLMIMRHYDPAIFVFYLMHDYAFSAVTRGATPDVLIEREKLFTNRLREVLQSDVDEVLVVGHSSGAHVAVEVIAELIRSGGLKDTKPKLAFLSLGGVIPMVSFLPEAKQLRRDLHEICQNPDITWIDVSAPGDGSSFALADPVFVSGVAPPEDVKIWPKILSAAFSESLSPELDQSTKWRFFRRHFQYLCCFDKPRGYDYFLITAGPLYLRDRYAERGSTASRIEKVYSPYREMD